MKYEKRYIPDKLFDLLVYVSNFKIRAILNLLRYTGLRPIEILSLKKTNMDLDNKRISVVIRKKKKLTIRNKYLHQKVIDSIHIYMQYHKPKGNYLFPQYHNISKHYTHISLYEAMIRTSKKLKLKIPIRPYELRRKFALDIYEKSNHDIKLTAQALNHADLSSVHHYIGILDEAKERNIISSLS